MKRPGQEQATAMPRFRLLSGLKGGGSSHVPDGAVHPGLAATYRLRVVALGTLILVTALPMLFVYTALQPRGISATSLLLLGGLGVAGLCGLVLSPWDTLLASRWATPVLWGWSLYGIAIAGVAVYLDGGGQSSGFLLMPLLMVFFAIAYTKRSQVGLFVVVVGVYSAAVFMRDWNITAADYFIRIMTLGLITAVASVVSGWLMTEMLDRARSITTAEQRGGMLDTVARAARRVSSLDASNVLGGALSGAMELGCFEAEAWLMDGEPSVLTLQRRIAIEPSSPNENIAKRVFELVRATGKTQIEPAGPDRLVACLLQKEGEPAGILLVKMNSIDSQDTLIIECLELLATQVSAGLDVARNVAERRGLEERLAHWAFHDALTDLPNRVLFADRLELALARTFRDNSKIAILFLDLDDFKAINDTHGHSAGDELLRRVAESIHSCLRPNDTLARYGGDEFVVLIEQIDDPETAIAVARRILTALGDPVEINGKHLNVRTSIGIAMTSARPGADSDALRRADMAMYEAKAAGGSRFVLSLSSETEVTTPSTPTEEVS